MESRVSIRRLSVTKVVVSPQCSSHVELLSKTNEVSFENNDCNRELRSLLEYRLVFGPRTRPE